MSIFSPSRCVLLLNDEGVSIYDSGARRVEPIEDFPWETHNFETVVADAIRRKCKGKSVVILNDMVEQHYRKEKVPKASALDRASIIKRRISAAFPSYPLRSALKLKEKMAAKDALSMEGDLYLFAAVPLSENIRKIIDAVQQSYASIAGLTLLPVESSAMVQTLSKKISKGAPPPVWTIFVGQHHSGGLRQIVTKNGELALTRMTPIVDTDADQDAWTADVANEVKGTMSYLSRFGFDARDGLDVIIIANNAVADKLTASIDFDCNLNVLTSNEAAGLLGMPIGIQNDQRYADPLHVVWSGRKAKLTMPLDSAQLSSIAGPSQAATVASLILLVGCGYFGYQLFNQITEISHNSSQLSSVKTEIADSQKTYDAEVEKKKAIGIDVVLIEASTGAYHKLELSGMRPLGVMDAIGRSLGPDLHLRSLSVTPPKKAEPPAGVAAAAPPAPEGGPAAAGEQPTKFQTVISLTFPAALAPEKGVKIVADLEQRLKTNLPDYEVKVIKQVADLTYTGNFVGEAGGGQKQGGPAQDYEAQIMISGALL